MKFVLLASMFLVATGGRISHLPGIPYLSTNQYNGFLNVSNSHRIHYWFVESQGDPVKDPVFLWLSGGPGCSSLYALFAEIGPYMVTKNGEGLAENPYSWNRLANLLFFESPVGTGFSTDIVQHMDDERAMNDNYAALTEFFKEFPTFLANDFYLTGESYAAVFLPKLAEKILKEKANHSINFKGMAIIAGCLFLENAAETSLAFQYYHGAIDQRLYEYVLKKCCKNGTSSCRFLEKTKDELCANLLLQMSLLSGSKLSINPYNIHAQCRLEMQSRKKRSSKADSLFCIADQACVAYLNRADVRQALSITPEFGNWSICNKQYSIKKNYEITFGSMSREVRAVVDAGVKTLLAFGDLDTVCNLVSGETFASNLGYMASEPKYAFTLDSAHAGMMTRYGNLEVAIVQGAGHMIPTDKPKVALFLMENFIHRQNCETLYNDNTTDLKLTPLYQKKLSFLKPLPPLKTTTASMLNGSNTETATELTSSSTIFRHCSLLILFCTLLLLMTWF